GTEVDPRRRRAAPQAGVTDAAHDGFAHLLPAAYSVGIRVSCPGGSQVNPRGGGTAPQAGAVNASHGGLAHLLATTHAVGTRLRRARGVQVYDRPLSMRGGQRDDEEK